MDGVCLEASALFKLRLDVACSPGRLHLVFEFVDSNLKQPWAQLRVGQLTGVWVHLSLLQISRAYQVHEKVWAPSGSSSCPILRNPWRIYEELWTSWTDLDLPAWDCHPIGQGTLSTQAAHAGHRLLPRQKVHVSFVGSLLSDLRNGLLSWQQLAFAHSCRCAQDHSQRPKAGIWACLVKQCSNCM